MTNRANKERDENSRNKNTGRNNEHTNYHSSSTQQEKGNKAKKEIGEYIEFEEVKEK